MMNRFLPGILLLAGLVLSSGCSNKHARRADKPGADPKVQFASQLPAGVYDASVEADMTIETSKPSTQKAVVKVLMDLSASLEATDKAGNQPGSFWFRRMRFEMMGFTIDTDEKLPEPERGTPWGRPGALHTETDKRQEVVRLFKTLIGPRVTGVLDKDGNFNVTKDDLAEAIRKDSRLGSSPGFDQIGKMAEMFRSAERLNPGTAAGTGAIWHKMADKDVPGVGKVAIEVEYELVSLEDTPQGRVARVRAFSHMGDNLKGLAVKNVTLKALDMDLEEETRLVVATGLAMEANIAMKGGMEYTQGSQEVKAHLDTTMKATIKLAAGAVAAER